MSEMLSSFMALVNFIFSTVLCLLTRVVGFSLSCLDMLSDLYSLISE